MGLEVLPLAVPLGAITIAILIGYLVSEKIDTATVNWRGLRSGLLMLLVVGPPTLLGFWALDLFWGEVVTAPFSSASLGYLSLLYALTIVSVTVAACVLRVLHREVGRRVCAGCANDEPTRVFWCDQCARERFRSS